VVGEDMWLSQIAKLDGFAIVGKFCGRRMSTVFVSLWLEESWVHVLGYSPIFHLMSEMDQFRLQNKS
jgi:hypothetical protein